jgi:hypothetical protein
MLCTHLTEWQFSMLSRSKLELATWTCNAEIHTFQPCLLTGRSIVTARSDALSQNQTTSTAYASLAIREALGTIKYISKNARKKFLGMLKEPVSGYRVIQVMPDEQSVS